jgi:hypothetical protein
MTWQFTITVLIVLAAAIALVVPADDGRGKP